jgi:xylulose-5-phosphate/fructose-6-phosphate phosphoketolase
MEEGTTTTAFDMAMLNGIDRFQLAIDAIDRVPGLAERHSLLRQSLQDQRIRAHNHTRSHGEDMAEIRDWTLGG